MTGTRAARCCSARTVFSVPRLLVVLVCIACALPHHACSTAPQARARVTASQADPALLPAQRLAFLADLERSNPPASAPLPAPPGVDAQLLEALPHDHPTARLPLAEAVAAAVASSPLPESPAAPDVVDRDAAVRHYVKGRDAAARDQHLVAITEFNASLKADPANPAALRELARSYAISGRPARAMAVYEQLLALEPDDTRAALLVAVAAANRRDFQQSVAIIGRVRQSGRSFDFDPAGEVIANFTLATALRAIGYDLASIQASMLALDVSETAAIETQFTQELGSIYRQRGDLLQSVGDSWCRLGNFSEAINAYRAAAELPAADPAGITPRLVFAHLMLGRPFAAQHTLVDSISRNPEALAEREIRLCAYLAQHTEDTSILSDVLADLYRRYPDSPAMARASATLLPPPQAVTLLSEFLQRRPADPQVTQLLLNWLAQRDLLAACELTVGLMAANPEFAPSLASRLAAASPRPSQLPTVLRRLPASPERDALESRIRAGVSDLGGAWTVVGNALERWPDDAALTALQIDLAAALEETSLVDRVIAGAQASTDTRVLLAIAQANRVVGRLDDAQAAVLQVIETDSPPPHAYVELARILATRANAAGSESERARYVDEAVAVAEKAIAIAPQDDAAYEILLTLTAPTNQRPDQAQFRQVLRHLGQNNPKSRLAARLMAQEALNQRRYDDALQAALALYESDPTDAPSLRLAVNAWGVQNRSDAAEQWLEAALDKRPGDPVLLEQMTRVQVQAGRANHASSRLRAVMNDEPGNIAASILLESVLRSQGNTQEANVLAEKRLLMRPLGPRREIELAAIYAATDRPDEAVARIMWLLEHAEEADVPQLAAAVNVANRLGADDPRRDDLALSVADRAIALHPRAPLQIYGAALRALARTDRLDDRFDSYLTRAVEATAANTDLASALEWRELAQALIVEGKPLAASRVLRARLLGARLDTAPFVLLAMCTITADAAAGGQAEQTIALLAELQSRHRLADLPGLQEVTTLAEALYQTSQTYGFLGDDEGSRRLLAKTIELDPNHGMAMNNLGYSALEAGLSDDETIQTIERAFELVGENENVLDTIGWLRYKQGRFADEPHDPDAPGALTHFRRAIALAEDQSAEVHDHLGDTLWRLGEREPALDAWRTAASILDDPQRRQQLLENYRLVQQRVWGLIVADPQDLFRTHHTAVLDRVNAKIEAAESSRAPAIAPTFAEQAASNP